MISVVAQRTNVYIAIPYFSHISPSSTRTSPKERIFSKLDLTKPHWRKSKHLRDVKEYRQSAGRRLTGTDTVGGGG